MFRPFACVALALLTQLTLAVPARGAALPFLGTLTVEIVKLPPLVVTGAGLATLNGAGPLGALGSVAFDAGSFGGVVSIPLTDPALLPFEGVAASASNGPALFTLNGPMAIQGVAHLCLFDPCNGSPVSNIVVPFTQNGTRGVGLGGGPIAVAGVVNITVEGAPWTTGMVSLGTGARTGFVHGPASGGASSAAAVSGRIRLVTPISIRSNIGVSPVLPSFAVLELHFVPEPGTLALVVLGVAVLGVVRRRLQHLEP